jgi:hypothetical protein
MPVDRAIGPKTGISLRVIAASGNCGTTAANRSTTMRQLITA